MAKERAIFAGGCFWCMVEPFEDRQGIITVTCGYTGGNVDNPTYEQVKHHITGHTEAIEIIFDNEKITYGDLVELYWQAADPTDASGQFVDRGDNYRPVIFYTTDVQRDIAEKSKETLQASGRFDKPIVTSIEPAKEFWVAEDYHQGFYRKHPEHYKAEIQERRNFIMAHWSDKKEIGK